MKLPVPSSFLANFFFKLPRRALPAALLALAFHPAFAEESTADSSPGDFAFEDFLNRNWTNELVFFPLTPDQLKSAENGKRLVGPDNQPVTYQRAEDGQIAFAANVPPFGKISYHFTDDPAVEISTGVTVMETAEVIELTNGKTGVRIRKQLSEGQGPVAGIQLPDGKWTGDSRLEGITGATYEAAIESRGPVFADGRCRVSANGKQWTVRFRLQAGEPVILLDEQFDLGEGAKWKMILSGSDYLPDHLLYRTGTGPGITERALIKSEPIPAEAGKEFFTLYPWVPWWRNFSGKWIGLYPESGTALLMAGTRDGDLWKEPGSKIPLPRLPIAREENGIAISLALNNGRRNWMIGAVNKSEGLAVLGPQPDALSELEVKGGGAGKPDANAIPVPQQYVIKHEFPLDKIRRYVLEWDSTLSHPRLLLTRTELESLRANPPEKLSKKLRIDPNKKASLDQQGSLFGWFLVTGGDPETAAQYKGGALGAAQNAVNALVNQPPNSNSLGMAPHQHYPIIAGAAMLADAVMGENLLAPEELRRLRAQLAFIGYTVNRGDYWSPERGYASLPNMTSFVAGEQTAYGCLLLSHPEGKKWAERGLNEFAHERDNWSDENGGCLEAPHYSMATLDAMLAGFTMGKNSGFADQLFHPRLKKIGEWFAKITTPPDSRIHGWRHLPPIGNTFRNEPTGEFGLLAALWREQDPKFASEMQWMHQASGAKPAPGYGGHYPMLGNYRPLIMDLGSSVPPVMPNYGSELFPETNVVLRNHFGTDRETSLLFISGKNHGHYDIDSGSFTLWGKGRVIADDFGYYMRAPAEEHNLVTSPFFKEAMKTEKFVPLAGMDYLKGVCEKWTRQIVFVKDQDPLGPNYFVITDGFPVPGNAVWRMWSPCESIALDGATARITGRDDVDTDVFFSQPAEVKLSQEEKTIATFALEPDLRPKVPPGSTRFNRFPMTQTAVIAEARTQAFTATIFPRLKTEKSPVFSPLADGKGVKVVTDFGTDYVFLAPREFSFSEDGIHFRGTVGLARIHAKGGTTLALGAPGKISSGKQVLESDSPAEKSWPNPSARTRDPIRSSQFTR